MNLKNIIKASNWEELREVFLKNYPDQEKLIDGVKFVEESIQQLINEQSNEVIVKILAVIWFVSNRRTKIGREYLDLIHHYTNIENDQGARLS